MSVEELPSHSPAGDPPGFRASMDALLPYRTRVAALTALASNGAFVIVDAATLPSSALLQRTLVRAAFTPVLLLLMWLATHEAGRRFPHAVVLGLAGVLAVDLALIGASMPAADNVGFFPAMLFFAAFLPLPRRHTILMSVVFVAAFLAVHLVFGPSPLAAVLKHAGNLLVTAAIATVAAGLSERLARSEFTAVRELEAASRRLAEARRMKDQFFADVSHELRTPLTSALLAIQERSGELHPAERPLRRLHKLVDEMLELSRLDAGGFTPGDSVLELGDAGRRLCNEFDSAFVAKGLSLRYELPDGPAWVRIGADAFDRVAVNLLGNALKYARRGGHVLLRVARTDGQVLLEVEDDGPGIDASDLPRIFQRFVRAERGGAPGSGIGLAVAREVAELHGGLLSCASVPGQRTVFTATWPLAPPPPLVIGPEQRVEGRVEDAIAAALDGAPIGELEAAPAAGSDKPVVLIVEDHAELAHRIASALGPSLRTRVVHDGAEAVALARELRPDLVICDVLLPGLHGHEVVRALRAHPGTREAPILLLTALSEREHVLAGLEAGADDTMGKPFDAGMLRARAEALVRLKRRRDGSAVALQQLRALCHGFALALGYDAVALLVRDPKGDLSQATWGGPSEPPAGWADAASALLRPAEEGARVVKAQGVPLVAEPAALTRFGTLIAAPIVREGRCAGLLVGLANAARPAPSSVAESLSLAASCAAAFLDQEREVSALSQLADERRRLSSAVLSGQDSERRRLALELHDGAGQVLVGALLHLDLALRKTESPQLAQSRSLVAQALADIRSVSRDLHPPALQQHGLVGALRQLAQGLSTERTPVEAALEAVPELMPAAALGLFRIAQAALTNTVRHACASRAVVRLRIASGEVLLEVEDDGVGYAPERTDHGIGVPGMRERAASLGGALVIQSALGHGTKVQAAVPLSAARL